MLQEASKVEEWFLLPYQRLQNSCYIACFISQWFDININENLHQFTKQRDGKSSSYNVFKHNSLDILRLDIRFLSFVIHSCHVKVLSDILQMHKNQFTKLSSLKCTYYCSNYVAGFENISGNNNYHNILVRLILLIVGATKRGKRARKFSLCLVAIRLYSCLNNSCTHCHWSVRLRQWVWRQRSEAATGKLDLDFSLN